MEHGGQGGLCSLRPWFIEQGCAVGTVVPPQVPLQDQALTIQLPGVLVADACSQDSPKRCSYHRICLLREALANDWLLLATKAWSP